MPILKKVESRMRDVGKSEVGSRKPLRGLCNIHDEQSTLTSKNFYGFLKSVTHNTTYVYQ